MPDLELDLVVASSLTLPGTSCCCVASGDMVAFCGICRRGFKEWADLHNHNMSKHRDRINPPWAVPGLPPPPQWPARPLPPPPPLAYQQHQQGGGAMAFPVAPPPPPPGLPSYVTRSIPLALTSSPGPAPFTIKVDPAASSVATADEQVGGRAVTGGRSACPCSSSVVRGGDEGRGASHSMWPRCACLSATCPPPCLPHT